MYAAIERAYTYAVKNYTPGMNNDLLVLSDGSNEDAGNSTSLQQLLTSVAETYDPKKPVRLNLVLTNPGENMAQMRKVAAAGKGQAVPVRSMADMTKVFASAIFN